MPSNEFMLICDISTDVIIHFVFILFSALRNRIKTSEQSSDLRRQQRQRQWPHPTLPRRVREQRNFARRICHPSPFRYSGYLFDSNYTSLSGYVEAYCQPVLQNIHQVLKKVLRSLLFLSKKLSRLFVWWNWCCQEIVVLIFPYSSHPRSVKLFYNCNILWI